MKDGGQGVADLALCCLEPPNAILGVVLEPAGRQLCLISTLQVRPCTEIIRSSTDVSCSARSYTHAVRGIVITRLVALLRVSAVANTLFGRRAL
jgi:hypothetical protein